jgi:hypothetical protein
MRKDQNIGITKVAKSGLFGFFLNYQCIRTVLDGTVYKKFFLFPGVFCHPLIFTREFARSLLQKLLDVG